MSHRSPDPKPHDTSPLGASQLDGAVANFPVIQFPFFQLGTDVNADRTLEQIANNIDHVDQSIAQSMAGLGPAGFAAAQMETPQFDRVEDPGKWIEPQTPPQQPRDKSSKTTKVEAALTGLVDSILERFPIAAPTLLLFAGTEMNSHTDETCLKIANGLAAKNAGRVLLVDSNESCPLSSSRHLLSEKGALDILDSGANWEECIMDQAFDGLDFMPIGAGDGERWGAAERLRKAAAELKGRYQFVCVSGGDAHSTIAKTWSGICDGSYLLVSLNNSNEAIAESAITELQSSGARLLGCVVTDA